MMEKANELRNTRS